MEKVKTLCIIQARMGSTRLPGKSLMKIAGVPLLARVVSRAKLAKRINQMVVATTTDKKDEAIEKLCKRIGVDCFRGSEQDVLGRFYQCALKYPGYSNIIRLTGDCPLTDPLIIDEVVELFLGGGFDYAANINPETFPDGLDVEVFTREALEISAREAKLKSESEHVTQYIRKNEKFKKGNLSAPQNLSKFRLTVDNPEDLEVIRFLVENSNPESGYSDYVKLLTRNPDLFAKNVHIERNEGLKKSLKEDSLIKK